MSLTSLPVELKRRIIEQLPWRVRWQVLQVDRALFQALDQDALDGLLRLLAAAPEETVYRMSHGLRVWRVGKRRDGSWMFTGLEKEPVSNLQLPELEKRVRGAFTGAGRRYRVWLHADGDPEPQGF